MYLVRKVIGKTSNDFRVRTYTFYVRVFGISKTRLTGYQHIVTADVDGHVEF